MRNIFFFILTISFEIDRLFFMNRNLKHVWVIIGITIVLFLSCTSTEPVSQAPLITEEPVVSIQEEPVVVQEQLPLEEPQEEVVVNDETGFEISKEEYDKTKDEISELINTLNSIISNRNYEKWKLFLSEGYIKTYNDPVELKKISDQSQILSQNNIVLKNLKDYFEWVVVPSRSSAWVDDIVFLDDTHLTVYMIIKEKNTILYQLESINDNWKISVW